MMIYSLKIKELLVFKTSQMTEVDLYDSFENLFYRSGVITNIELFFDVKSRYPQTSLMTEQTTRV